jgi:hypothetical protein
VRPLLNEKRSPKSPVVLLYEIPHVAESEVRDIFPAMVVSWAVLLPWSFWRATRRESPAVTVPDPATNPVRRDEREIFELKVFQSVAERAPVVVLLASQMERPVPTRESQFVGERIERAPCLLLNVFQSVPVSAPVVVEFAFQIENTPVVLLYERGPRAEREVSPIFVATTPERVARLALVRARLPERVFTVHERVAMLPVAVARFVWRVTMFPVAVARLEFVVARLVVRVIMFIVFVAVWPERVAMLPVAVAILELIVTSWPVIVAMFVLAVVISVSCTVFDPWSFWNAWRIESAEVTVPDPAMNHERREVRLSLPEKVL